MFVCHLQETWALLVLINTGVPRAAGEARSLLERCHKEGPHGQDPCPRPQAFSISPVSYTGIQHQLLFGVKDSSSANEEKHTSEMDVDCYMLE